MHDLHTQVESSIGTLDIRASLDGQYADQRLSDDELNSAVTESLRQLQQPYWQNAASSDQPDQSGRRTESETSVHSDSQRFSTVIRNDYGTIKVDASIQGSRFNAPQAVIARAAGAIGCQLRSQLDESIASTPENRSQIEQFERDAAETMASSEFGQHRAGPSSTR